jgi:nicotinamide mononucleotide adenylyltransferase
LNYAVAISPQYQTPMPSLGFLILIQLAHSSHRVRMCQLACQNTWMMVDAWEASQPIYIRTAKVLDHFQEELSKIKLTNSSKPYRIMLVAGGDLIQSFAVPNLWKEDDVA